MSQLRDAPADVGLAVADRLTAWFGTGPRRAAKCASNRFEHRRSRSRMRRGHVIEELSGDTSKQEWFSGVHS